MRFSLKTGGALLAAALAPLALGTARAQTPADAAARLGAVLQIADGEYGLAVDASGIVDSLEYGETRLLVDQARRLARPLLAQGEFGSALGPALDSLEARVARVASPAEVHTTVQELGGILADGWGVAAVPIPTSAPSSQRGARVYAANCAICHGSAGQGDGPALSMEPPPTDFTDPVVSMELTPARIFQVTSYGIPGTRMDGWLHVLDRQDVWDVTAHVLRLAHSPDERDEGQAAYRTHCAECHGTAGKGARSVVSPGGGPPSDLTDLQTVAGMSGLDLSRLVREGHASAPSAPLGERQLRALVAYVRTLPERGESARQARDLPAIAEGVRGELRRALELREADRHAEAEDAALDAYMIFERLERRSRVEAPDLTGRLEGDFFAFRQSVGDPQATDVPAIAGSIEEGLEAVLDRLEQGTGPWSAFLQSLLIMVREGVEAILLIGALLAFLVRSGNAEHRPSVIWGVGVAIAASLLTAVAVELVFHMAPASQEVLEGITMLAAVAVLFYVSYWLVSKIQHQRWERYIREKMGAALSRRSQFALGAIAFLAVYREGFETVLFYKALMGVTSASVMVFAGLVVGLAAMIVLAVLIYRFGVRIPLRPFFAVTSAFLYLMAFIFAGKGIRELQEAGVVAITAVRGVPEIPALGIYATAEGLLLQAVLIGALGAAVVWTFLVTPVRSRVQEAVD